MNRIFLIVAIVSNALLATALVLGWNIEDAAALDDTARGQVFLIALLSSIFAILVHAIVLTYFMGTGRWIEETSQTYGLGPDRHTASTRLKYRAIPTMLICLILIIGTGAFGAIADPASDSSVPGDVMIHLTLAVTMVCVNIVASWLEYDWIKRNGDIVDEVVRDVRRIRIEKGLDPEQPLVEST